jgi:hypothetical protein
MEIRLSPVHSWVPFGSGCGQSTEHPWRMKPMHPHWSVGSSASIPSWPRAAYWNAFTAIATNKPVRMMPFAPIATASHLVSQVVGTMSPYPIVMAVMHAKYIPFVTLHPSIKAVRAPRLKFKTTDAESIGHATPIPRANARRNWRRTIFGRMFRNSVKSVAWNVRFHGLRRSTDGGAKGSGARVLMDAFAAPCISFGAHRDACLQRPS